MKSKVVFVAFLLLLYIGPMIFISSYASPAILAEPNINKDLRIGPAYTVADGENWLSGWAYRQSHIINNATGASENYTVRFVGMYGSEGSGDEDYFADNGFYSPTFGIKNYPAPFYYDEYTYIVWHGEDNSGDVFITAYNHTSDEWLSTVKVNEGVAGGSDGHGCPSMCIDGNGYIHVFFGGHDPAEPDIQHSKSDNAVPDITTWTLQSEPTTTDNSYPRCFANGSDIYLFFRPDTGTYEDNLAYMKSTDNGATWEGLGTIYPLVDGDPSGSGEQKAVYSANHDLFDDDCIGFSWVYWDYVAAERRDLYYAYLNISDDHIYNVTGYDFGADLSFVELDKCTVVDSGTDFIDHATTHHDSNGYPYLIYSNGTDMTDAYFPASFVKWTGSTWSVPETITMTDGRNHHDFIIHSSSNIELYLVANSSEGTGEIYGGDIEQWDWNGVSWSYDYTVLNVSQSNENRLLVYPTIPWNYTDELKMIFHDFTENYVDFDARLYAWNGTSFVERSFLGDETFYMDSKSQADFDDVRFTDNDGDTLLDYWTEEKTDSDSAVFWVKVADNLNTTDVQIYVYYGNAGASSISNGTDTLIFFDDFEDQDFEEWDNSGSCWSISSAQAAQGTYSAFADSDTTGRQIDIAFDQKRDFLMHYWIWKDDEVSATRNYLAMAEDEDSTLSYGMIIDYEGTDVWAYYNGTYYDWPLNNNEVLEDQWYEMEWAVNFDGDYHRAWEGGTSMGSFTLADSAGGSVSYFTKFLVACANQIDHDFYIDDYYIRYWLEDEPIHGSWGVEELLKWMEVGEAELIFNVPLDETGLDMLLIFLGLIMIPLSTLYLVKGGRSEMSSDKLFYGLIAFAIGWALFLGGIM